MKKGLWGLLLLSSLLMPGCASPGTTRTSTPTLTPAATPASAPPAAIKLPEPRTKGEVSLEETLFKRRSVREYAKAPLTLEEVSQLMWAAQGLTAEWGGRTAPSAGALYPLEVYLAVGNVENLGSGVYKYRPAGHELAKVGDKDVIQELFEASLKQSCVRDGAVVIVIAAVHERTTQKYGERGVRYVYMEAGHAAQNVYLQATALGLGTVTVGAFYDDQIKAILGIPQNEVPLYVIPAGRKS